MSRTDPAGARVSDACALAQRGFDSARRKRFSAVMWTFVTPQLPVADVEATQAYYRDVLGFKVGFTRGKDFGAVHFGTSEIFFTRAEAPHPVSVCCVRVEDVDGLFAIYRERGARIVESLETKPWRMREFTIEDPNGHRFRIGQSTR